MEATMLRHASSSRASRFASIGVTGVWVLIVALGAIPARAQEPAAALPEIPVGTLEPAPGTAPPEIPAGTTAPAQAPAPSTPPAPVVRPHYGSYLFFGPGGRSTNAPANDPVRIAPRPHPTRQPYLFFPPGKPAGARGPGEVKPPEAPRPDHAIPEAGAVHPSGPRTLIYFTPTPGWSRDKANGGSTRPPSNAVGANVPSNRPSPLAVAEKVPVRVPDGKMRKPAPYLIFQPKQARKDSPSRTTGLDRPVTSAAKSSAPVPAPARIAVGHRPEPEKATRPAPARPSVPVRAPVIAPANAPRPRTGGAGNTREVPKARPKPRPVPVPPSYRLALENPYPHQADRETIIPLPIPASARQRRTASPPPVGLAGERPETSSAALPVPALTLPPLPGPFTSRPRSRPTRPESPGAPREAPDASWSEPIRLTGAEAAPAPAGRPRFGGGARPAAAPPRP